MRFVLINFLSFLRWCLSYQILPEMQKMKCFKKSQLPNGNKQGHPFKKWRGKPGKD